MAKVANLGVGISLGPNRRGKIGAESPRSLGPSSGCLVLQRTLKKFYWSDNDFLLDDDVVVVDVLGQIVAQCGVELWQAVHCEMAGVEATHLTRYRQQIMVVVLYRLDAHAFEPEGVTGSDADP